MFSEKIKQLRLENKLSQEEFAKKLDVSAQLISKWENDLSTPNPEMLSFIADYFEVTTDFLLGRTTKEKISHAQVIENEQLDKKKQKIKYYEFSDGSTIDELSEENKMLFNAIVSTIEKNIRDSKK